MVARTNPGPAEDDITDTDEAIPVFQRVHSGRILCCASCAGGTTAGPRDHLPPAAYRHRAIAHVTRELEAWQQEQQAAGIRRWPMFRPL